MEKRYQVFVSSTFTDLIDERRAVMQALLELDCMPAGMELFPASSDDQWTLIKRVIDDCDYYLVVIGGRYGSLDQSGISYTEREYDYAVQQGKPAMGFLHKDPGLIPSRHAERDADRAAKLNAFRGKVQRRMCKYWANADELGAIVSRSYVQLIRTHPAEGWVKSRYAKTTEDLEKVNRMHEQVRVLEQELVRLRQAERRSPGDLAQGDDPVVLDYSFYRDRTRERDAFIAQGGDVAAWDSANARTRESDTFATTWNQVFPIVAAVAMDLRPVEDIEDAVNKWIELQTDGRFHVSITEPAFNRIKIQFFSLGLFETQVVLQPATEFRREAGSPIAQAVTTSRPVKIWALTEEGRILFGRLAAAKKEVAAGG